MVKFEQVIATLSSYCVAKTYVLAQFLTTYLVWKYQFTIFILLKNGFLYVIAFILISQIGKKIYSKYIVRWNAFVNWFKDCNKTWLLSATRSTCLLFRVAEYSNVLNAIQVKHSFAQKKGLKCYPNYHSYNCC